MAEIDRAAKFPVGDGLQPDLFLQPDRIANAAVLDFVQPFRRERARLELLACALQFRWPQEAPDMFGAKRWRRTAPLGVPGHAACLVRFITAMVQPTEKIGIGA